ncbi:unnamed protein product (mitochondrion) [Plasmodiophora brassicae]|uniref:Uncharacterized protein n=1 Tax=Plasmodiophora brassicae TaxID=37360 RepID=A0A3P3Y390_PLABS|nr:unnamed protein product [Plasmodiophora brassicae]
MGGPSAAAVMQRLLPTAVRCRCRPGIRLLCYSTPGLREVWYAVTNSEGVKVMDGGAREHPDELGKLETRMLGVMMPTTHEVLNSDTVLDSIETSACEPFRIVIPNRVIYVQDIDDQMRYLESFTKITVESDRDVKNVLCEGAGVALQPVSDALAPVATRMVHLRDSCQYRIVPSDNKPIVEKPKPPVPRNPAVEDKVVGSVRQWLMKHFGEKEGESAIALPRKLYHPMDKQQETCLQEWEAVFRIGDTIYLCDAQYHVPGRVINSELSNAAVQDKVAAFKRMQRAGFLDAMYREGVSRVVGVTCTAAPAPHVEQPGPSLLHRIPY